MRYLICYDIVDDRRRKHLANVMLDYGTRVQDSVFECDLTAVRLRALLSRAFPLIDFRADSLRVYRVCAACRLEQKNFGNDLAVVLPRTIVV